MAETSRIWVVDRIEGEYAVLVDQQSGTQVDVLASWLPGAVGEGQVLTVRFTLDEASTEALRKKVSATLERLTAGSSGPKDSGELEL